MRFQGYTSQTDDNGEILNESSAFVEIDRGNPAFYIDCSDLPSLTRQEFADECDINNLMAQFEKTGIIPSNVNKSEPRYLDVSDVPDLPAALSMLNEATTAFMSLPAKVRREFDNDPLQFIAFAENPDNLEKMREWNLAPPAPVEAPPQKVEVVNPTSQSDAPEKP